MAANREEGKTVIYNATGHEWRPFGNPKTVRPFESGENYTENGFSSVNNRTLVIFL